MQQIINSLNAITPLDGRNRKKIEPLSEFFADFALNKSRISIETSYFIALAKQKVVRSLTLKEIGYLKNLSFSFDEKEYEHLREIEKTTNHDMKAVEEWIKEKLNLTTLKDVSQMIHFGLTSDDTNNLANAILIRNAISAIIIPEIKKIEKTLLEFSKKYKGLPLLGRTHGQAAVPTTVGKEFFVYYKRLQNELEILKKLRLRGKLTGNVGNLNAHQFIFPKINWLKFSEKFVDSLGLEPDLVTTQIEPYDSLIRIFSSILHINDILQGLCVDMWIYISSGFFKQKVISKEVGSTALPHKVNPIYFEGAEGGFGIANALLEFYIRKLSHSKLQRDLSDSTVKRSFGIAFSYSLLSYQSVSQALSRIEPNREVLKKELDANWQVLSEAVQNFLRAEGDQNGYEKTKKFFRGKVSKKQEYLDFVKSLRLEKRDEEKLLNLTPEKYTGYAKEIIEQSIKI